MKHLITTLFAAMLCTTAAFSQIQYGIRGGLNYVNAYVKDPGGAHASTHPGTGFFLGGTAKIPFEKKLFFMPGIQYSFKHYTINYENSKESSCRMNIHYLEIPCLLNFDLKEAGNYAFIQFGPSFSAAISGNEQMSGQDKPTTTEKMKFAFNSYGRFEANAVVNLGYHFGDHLNIFAGYALGLGTIVNDDYGPVIKHRMVNLGLGYMFNR